MAKTKWSAVPAQRSSAPKLRKRVYVVLTALITSSLLGLFSGISWLKFQQPVIPPPPDQPRALGFAQAVAVDYLTGTGETLSAVEGVNTQSWEGNDLATLSEINYSTFRKIVYPKLGEFELYEFVIAGEIPRKLTVTVQIMGGELPVLVAQPALEPLALGTGASPMDWTQGDQVNLNADAEAAVSSWAEAYAADDRQQLRELSGDDQPGIYAGLGGYQAVDITIGGRVALGSTGDILVRVAFTLSGSAETETSAGGTRMEFDLRVANHSSAAPKVVAWGPAGTGGLLETFQNAIRS